MRTQNKENYCISHNLVKSITSKSIEKCKYLRVEEALGSDCSNYRLFLVPQVIAFDDMVSDGIYDFFLGNHYLRKIL